MLLLDVIKHEATAIGSFSALDPLIEIGNIVQADTNILVH